MMRMLLFLLLVGVGCLADHHHHHTDGDQNDLKNYDRACLDGFFYAGEPREDLPDDDDHHDDDKDWVWEEGSTSPVYSCYSVIQVGEDEEPMTLSGATIRCNDMKGQLLSINDTLETNILVGYDFINRIPQSNLSYLTSGLNLGFDNWTWFGADQPVNDDIIESLLVESANDDNETDGFSTQCILISWTKDENDTMSLMYKAVPCVDTFTHAICEVRVYTQTWYVWLGANWLQILFFFTLAVLIFSGCCVLQSWYWRSSHRDTTTVSPRRQRQSSFSNDLPPSYNDLHPSQDTRRSTAGRYAEKGKEILAKVIYYRPGSGNEKQ